MGVVTLAAEGDGVLLRPLPVVLAADHPWPGVDGLRPGGGSVTVEGGGVGGRGCQGQGTKGVLTLGVSWWPLRPEYLLPLDTTWACGAWTNHATSRRMKAAGTPLRGCWDLHLGTQR